MIISKIELLNYKSFVGYHCFELDSRGLVLVTGENRDELRMDSNGSGKSSLFNALGWCLYDHTAKGESIDSLISEKALSNEIRAIVHIQDDSRSIVISRSRKGKKPHLDLLVDGRSETTLDIKETQKKVDALLGMDESIFYSTVFFSQEDLPHYADSTTTQRMDILTSILDLEKLDELKGKVEAKYTEINCLTSDIYAKLEVYKSDLEKLDDDLSTIDQRKEDWELKRSNDVFGIQQGIAQAIQERDSINIQSAEYGIESLEKVLNRIEGDRLAKSVIFDSIKTLNSSIVKKQTDLLELDKYIENLCTEKAICPTCSQPIPIASVTEQVNKCTQSRTELIRALSEDQKAFMDLQSRANDLDADIDINGHKDELNRLRVQKTQFSHLEINIKNLSSQLQNKKDEKNPWIEFEEMNRSKLQELNAIVVQEEGRKAKLELLKKYYDFWVKAFGTRGLKSYILDSKLQELNSSINYWMNILTGGTVWVKLDSTKITKQNKLVNAPSVIVCRWDGNNIVERDYKSWSGGEKQRISLAIDFGLASLVGTRATKKHEILILDEIFKFLDKSGKEAVMELLQKLAQEKRSVFVIDHDSDFQNLFESKIKIVKENGKSKIRESSNEQQKQNEAPSKNPVLQVGRDTKRIPIKQPV